jgi:AbrB family looped-hinge helix DNA binding protein
MQQLTSTVSSKGQVTIPLEIRKRLGLRSGDRIEFATSKDGTVIRPVNEKGNPFEAYIGVFPAFPGGIKEINEWIRDMRDEEVPRRKSRRK